MHATLSLWKWVNIMPCMYMCESGSDTEVVKLPSLCHFLVIFVDSVFIRECHLHGKMFANRFRILLNGMQETSYELCGDLLMDCRATVDHKTLH